MPSPVPVRLAGLLLVLGACGGTTEPRGTASLATCVPIEASACMQPVPSYSSDVAPLLDRDCNNTCHAPDAGPWPLNAYPLVADWRDQLARDVRSCSMPPPDAGALTTSERELFLDWAACGAPNN